MCKVEARFNLHFCSSFSANDGGRGGVVSTSYLPLMFDGNNSFHSNRGTSLAVSVEFHYNVPHVEKELHSSYI